jgi:hypothetical protein
LARKVFFSFHYKPDNWRASQVRSMGALEGNQPVSDNDWEAVTSGGDAAIQRWIADQMSGKSCAVILIGSATAGRKWITHEIQTAWGGNKGVVGIYIHNLKNSQGLKATKGSNPFDYLTMTRNQANMSTVVKAYDPPYTKSKNVYDHIQSNIDAWVEEAIKIRNNY